MNSRQDQNNRGGRSAVALDTARGADRSRDGQPMSRREAREAERRAAEALAAGQSHPSGVVDFTARDLRDEYGSDQAFQVQDTTDIWAAISRRSDVPPAPVVPPADQLARFQSGVPEAPAVQRPTTNEQSAVSGEMLDRVRGAVLGRGREQQSTAAIGASDQTRLTRRELRAQQEAGARDDDLPADWFSQGATPEQPTAPRLPYDASTVIHPGVDRGAGTRPSTTTPPAVSPNAYAGAGMFADPIAYADPNAPVDYDEAYYDAPYQPEPTAAIQALHPTDLGAPTPMTAPVNLPQFFAEPAGDDALTFSSPVITTPAEPRAEDVRVDPAFIEPRSPWGDLGSRSAAATPASTSFLQRPATAPAPEAPAAFSSPQLGPPSEVTDLAGFEALIRQARNTPPAPQRAEAPVAKPSLPWADDEDVQDGFTGLLSRSVQGSHGSPNALILPNDPQLDLTQAVSRTGDIFITGSMNLPRSLSTTGATTDYVDPLDIDHLFEGSQGEATGVAPVRASTAISGSGKDRSFITGRRSRGNVVPTVLAIIAGAMAVGVVALVVVSWLVGKF